MDSLSARRSQTAAVALLGATLLSACGGGGGSPGGGVTTPAPPAASIPTPTPTPTPAPPPPPPPPPPVVIPATTSSEYRRNSALAQIKPEAAWSQGATGAGIVVAVIDTGVMTGEAELAGRLQTYDIIADRTGEPEDRHGSHVANIIGSAFNNAQTVGVAYEAAILGIRADTVGTCASEDDCKFTSRNVATAIDYARMNGARVINLSLGSDSGSASELAAIQRAVDAGIAIVASAGNDGEVDPGYPARFAVDPRTRGGLIAAGALNEAGTDLASFSNKAGVGREGYLAAPGERIRTSCSTSGAGTSCWVVSGTSFSAPHIAGALALLLDGFPNISGADAVDILLRSARDMGDAGTDAVFGRGALDIERAFQPLGTLNTPTPAGQVLAVDGGAAPLSSLAFGDAMQVSDGLRTVGYDDYRRLFRIHLGNSWRKPQGANGLVSPAPITRRSASSTALPGGATLRLAVQTTAAERLSQSTSAADLGRDRERTATSLAFAKGPLRLDLWNGAGGIGSPAFEGAPSDSFIALAAPGRAVRAGLAVGRWTFSAESGGGVRDAVTAFDIMADPASGREQVSTYRRATAAFSGDGWGFAVANGAMNEPAGPLGSVIPVSSSFSMPAQSRFTSVQAGWRPAAGVDLTLQAAVGRTDADGRLLSIQDVRSSSWSLRAEIACGQLGLAACGGVSLSLGQPLRIEEGRLTAVLADLPAGYSDPLTFSRRNVGFSPSGRQIDLGIGFWRPLALPRMRDAALRLDAVALINPGHRADARTAAALNASFRAKF